MPKRGKNIYRRTVQTDTFGNVSAEWLDIQKLQLKASSIAKYTNILKLYLIPRYGARQMYTISRNDIMLLSRELLTAGGDFLLYVSGTRLHNGCLSRRYSGGEALY